MQSTPKAILLMGGPAAGKTTVREQQFGGYWVVDADSFKELDPEYDPKAITVAVHERSSEKASRALFAALGNADDFIYDSTGTNAERMVSIINDAKRAGFEVFARLRPLLTPGSATTQRGASAQRAGVDRPREAFDGRDQLQPCEALRRQSHRDQHGGMMLDRNTIEIVEYHSGEIEWTGSTEEFTAANVDGPLSEEESAFLDANGYVIVGGGAMPVVTIRYADEDATTVCDECRSNGPNCPEHGRNRGRA